MFTVVVTFSISDELTNYVLEPDCMFFFVFLGGGGGEGGLVYDNFCWGGGGGKREGYWGHILLKTPKIAHISEYLAADSSPDASPDVLALINNSKL